MNIIREQEKTTNTKGEPIRHTYTNNILNTHAHIRLRKQPTRDNNTNKQQLSQISYL